MRQTPTYLSWKITGHSSEEAKALQQWLSSRIDRPHRLLTFASASVGLPLRCRVSPCLGCFPLLEAHEVVLHEELHFLDLLEAMGRIPRGNDDRGQESTLTNANQRPIQRLQRHGFAQHAADAFQRFAGLAKLVGPTG